MTEVAVEAADGKAEQVHQDMRDEILAALRQPQPELPSKYFYDDRGARLFERICTLPEYYPTRAELAILEAYAADIAAELGPGCEIVEPGSGEGVKIRRLLSALDRPSVYRPIDVAGAQLDEAAATLRAEYPRLTVTPVHADFTRPLDLPPAQGRRVFFFPGSTIGNFLPEEAIGLLRQWHAVAGTQGRLLIGVDLRKDPETLRAAYNDAAGVTAEFNRNILRHINRALGADFVPEQWQHEATYDERSGRVEMWLQALRDQRVQLPPDAPLDFRAGQRIRTEYSCKYAIEEFEQLAGRAGWGPICAWTDPDALFSLQLFRAA